MEKEIEIWSKINTRQIKALMFHEQMADYFDFLGLMGFKREHEYRFFAENAEMRGVHRYVLNHHNVLLPEEPVEAVKAIPSSWYNYSRFDVDMATRKKAIEEAFSKWRVWEKETKAFYCEKFVELTANKSIADANKLNELITDVDMELKHLERQILELKAVDYDSFYVMQEQCKLHDKYKSMAEKIGVSIC